MISIKGLNKAEVLKALYDHSHIQGYGFLQAVPDGVVTVEHCEELLERTTYFDYLYGRVLKVNLSGDEFDESLYDRDCGSGAAARAVRSISNKDRSSYFCMLLDDNIDVTISNCMFIYGDRELKIRFNSIANIDKMIHCLEAHRRRVLEGKYE